MKKPLALCDISDNDSSVVDDTDTDLDFTLEVN